MGDEASPRYLPRYQSQNHLNQALVDRKTITLQHNLQKQRKGRTTNGKGSVTEQHNMRFPTITAQFSPVQFLIMGGRH